MPARRAQPEPRPVKTVPSPVRFTGRKSDHLRASARSHQPSATSSLRQNCESNGWAPGACESVSACETVVVVLRVFQSHRPHGVGCVRDLNLSRLLGKAFLLRAAGSAVSGWSHAEECHALWARAAACHGTQRYVRLVRRPVQFAQVLHLDVHECTTWSWWRWRRRRHVRR